MNEIPLPENHKLVFETVDEHHTRAVPIATPEETVDSLYARLRRQRYDAVAEVVVCDREGTLKGVAQFTDILDAPDGTPLSDIMDADPPLIAAGVDQETAAWQAIRHRHSSLIVVDGQRQFLGVILPQRIFEVLLWEHHEDTARLSGVLASGASAYSASEETVPLRLWHRLPWLLLGLAGAVVAADLVGAFQRSLEADLVLAFFIPGIVYLADAVGTQTETLAVRGLSVGVQVERVFAREAITGGLVGLVLAGILFPFVLFRWGRTDVAVAVSLALFSACSVASVIALILPWILQKSGQDPAFAAGPIATVIQDLLSLVIYFLVCLAIIR